MIKSEAGLNETFRLWGDPVAIRQLINNLDHNVQLRLNFRVERYSVTKIDTFHEALRNKALLSPKHPTYQCKSFKTEFQGTCTGECPRSDLSQGFYSLSLSVCSKIRNPTNST